MALEEVIAANTAALEKQTLAIEKLIASGEAGRQALLASMKGGTAAAPAATETTAPAVEDKPKTTAKPKADPKPKADAAETAAVTVETLDAKFRPWMGEFAKEHPETVARRAKFAELLGKLGEKKMSEITDAKKLASLDKWFETKAKVWDEGHGVGRFAADPEAEGAEEESGDDEL